MQFTIGWLKLRPGTRSLFLEEAKRGLALTQKEDGCLFFELHPSASDSDGVVLIEGWSSVEKHKAHLVAPHRPVLGDVVMKYATEGHFHEIEAAKVATFDPKFAT